MTKPPRTLQEGAQALEALRVTQSVCARQDRLEAAAPALLSALQRLLPNAIASRDAMQEKVAPSPLKTLLLEMLDSDINAAQEAIALVINQ